MRFWIECTRFDNGQAIHINIALVGSKERIRDRLAAWKESRARTLIIHAPNPEALQKTADVLMG